MPCLPRRILLAALLACAGCNGPDTGLPPIELEANLMFAPGQNGNLPTDTIGATTVVIVRVVDDRLRPIAGRIVHWQGEYYPNAGVSPEDSPSDVDGYSRTVWSYRAATGQQVLHAYLPGATGNPLEFRIQVVNPPNK